MIEYVMLLSVFVVAVSVGVTSLDETVENETVETAAEIGGSPPGLVTTVSPWGDDPTSVSTVAPPPTTVAPPVTGPVGLAPIVDAGPDNVIGPGTIHSQLGTASDPEGGPMDLWWWGNGPIEFPSGNETLAVEMRYNRPGTYQIGLQAYDADGNMGEDVAYITVTSGQVTPQGIDESYWLDKTQWQPQIEVDLVNQFGEYLGAGNTIELELTSSDGTVEVVTCITDTSGEVDCLGAVAPASVDYIDAVVLDIRGPHLDSWENFAGGSFRLDPGPPPNDPPVVNAGPDFAVEWGSSAFPIGTADDPDGDPLNFNWNVYKSEASTWKATVTNGDTLTPDITFPAPGEYIAYLEVDDGSNPTQFDYARIFVGSGITAELVDKSYWVDRDTWEPHVEIQYRDGNGDRIPVTATATLTVDPSGKTPRVDSCRRDAQSGDGICYYYTGWSDVNEDATVDITVTEITTPYGIPISLPPTITLEPPNGKRPPPGSTTTVAPTTRPPNTTTSTTTTTEPPRTTTTTTTRVPVTTTTTTTTTPAGL